jgi:DNA-binding transcriptional regulator YbjK
MKQRHEVKEVAVVMIKDEGLINLSRRELCRRAGIPDGSFPHVMGCNFSEFVEELKLDNIETTKHPVIKTRTNPALRKQYILAVAVEMAIANGYNKITRDKIAEAAGVSMGLVSRYFGTMQQLRRFIIRTAIHEHIPEIIAQGLANGDDHAKKAPDDLKAKAINLISNF